MDANVPRSKIHHKIHKASFPPLTSAHTVRTGSYVRRRPHIISPYWDCPYWLYRLSKHDMNYKWRCSTLKTWKTWSCHLTVTSKALCKNLEGQRSVLWILTAAFFPVKLKKESGPVLWAMYLSTDSSFTAWRGLEQEKTKTTHMWRILGDWC